MVAKEKNFWNRILLRDSFFDEDHEGRVEVASEWMNLCRMPPFEAFLYIFALITGLFGSVNGEMILRGFGEFAVFNRDDFNYAGTVFTVLAGVTSVLYIMQRWSLIVEREAQNRTYANSQDRIEASTERLEQSTGDLQESTNDLRREVRTMPPENFLSFAAYFLRIAENVTHTFSLEAAPTPEQLHDGIRRLLELYARTALLFDDRPNEPYHANVMTYHSPSEVIGNAAKALQSRLMFEREGVDITRLNGALDLRRNLSTQTEWSGSNLNTSPEPDSTLNTPLVIGIRKTIQQDDTSGRSKYLVPPGAPIAWAGKYAEGYSSTTDLLEWYDTNCVRDDQQRSAIQSYFANQDRIGSFYAAALILNQEDKKEDSFATPEDLIADENGFEVPIGVLNLHRRSEGILKDHPDASDYFLRVTRLFRIFLTRLLYQLRTAETDTHGTWLNLTENWEYQTGWPEDASPSAGNSR